MIDFSKIAGMLPLGLSDYEILTRCARIAGLAAHTMTEIEVRCFIQAYRMRRA